MAVLSIIIIAIVVYFFYKANENQKKFVSDENTFNPKGVITNYAGSTIQIKKRKLKVSQITGHK